MGVTIFDGPAGQVEAKSVGGLRRHHSHPSIEMDDPPNANNADSLSGAGINQRAVGNLTGAERRMSVNPFQKAVSRETLKTSPFTTRKPRYTLRTVTTSKPTAVEEPRPVFQHVPGSFRSEVSVATADDTASTTPILSSQSTELRHSNHDSEPSLLPFEPIAPALAAEDPSRAKKIAVKSSSQTLRSVRSHPSIGSTKSTTVTEIKGPFHNPFFKPYSSQILDLEPTSSTSKPLEDGNLPIESEKEETQTSTLSRAKSMEGITASLTHSIAADTIPDRSSSAFHTKNDPSLAALATVNLPLSNREQGLGDSTNLKEATGEEKPFGLKSGAAYTPSLYSRKTSLGQGESGQSCKPSRIVTREAADGQYTRSDNSSATLIRKAGRPEVLDQVVKEAPLEETQRSGLKSLAKLNKSNGVPSTAWTKHDMVDFINEASRLRRSLSMSSSSNTVSTADSSDMARLIQAAPKGKPLHNFPITVVSSPGAQTPSSRHHWVHHLLSRNSPTPRETHLTQRPSAIENVVLGRGHNDLASYRQLDAHDSSNKFVGSETSESPSMACRQPQADPETFTKVILDLESLMREVLLIAKHVAADKEGENMGPAVVLKSPTDVDSSTSYSRGTVYNRRTSSIDHAVSSEGVWATSDGNASHERGSPSDQMSVSGNHPGSATASQERRNLPTIQDESPYPAPLVVQPATPDLGQEFRSVSTHARELANRLGLPDPLAESPSKALQQRDERRESVLVGKSLIIQRGLYSPSVIDFATKARRGSAYPEAIELPVIPQRPLPSQLAAKEQRSFPLRGNLPPVDTSSQGTMERGNLPQIQARTSSALLRHGSLPRDGDEFHNVELGRVSSSDDSPLSFSGESTFRRHMSGLPYSQPGGIGPGNLPAQDTITTLRGPPARNTKDNDSSMDGVVQPRPNLKNVHHFSIRGPPEGFSLRHAHRRAPIARDWSNRRKRWVAFVTCLNTALLGIIIGIYAGEVPAIQYAIADENHYTILGNVVFYLGLAIPTFFFWPLPLLHGRKPYTLAALAILMPLQFPQALVVGSFRSPNSPMYRVGLLLSRSAAGIAIGFANFNFQTTLLDLFGASLQSGNPHQEVVNEDDVRRHGGGMGVWLGIWTWCSIGSLGVGFFIGAIIISGLNVAWGFWIAIVLTAAVLLLNVVTPEVRRSPYRRSLAEISQDSGDVSRRLARGEVMMHLYQTGPIHWWEEVRAGLVLSKRMLSQPAFVVMAVYLGWIYGQIVMVIILLGALTSRYYRFRPQYVGLCVLALPIGAALAIPFQRGNIFSRARHHPPRTDSMTFQKRFTWTSHLVRRIVFMLVLPFAGLAYTLSSAGPPTPFILPTIFAGAIGFLSNLAIAECFGIIMETFDTSDLQPGMTGRPRKVLSDSVQRMRTNFSCFPRVTSAFMICQTFSFIIAAAATGTGGRIERRLGAQTSTGVVAGVLLLLTAALTIILIRIKTVQVVPSKRWGTAQLSGPGDDWRPVIVGHPSGINRRVSLLEQGPMTRWVEIRRRNRLLDDQDRRAETFRTTAGREIGSTTGARGFGPGPGPGPSGVRDFVRGGVKDVERRK